MFLPYWSLTVSDPFLEPFLGISAVLRKARD
jgi:hypothetical protein